MPGNESWWSVAVRVPPGEVAAMTTEQAMGEWPVLDLRSIRLSDVAARPTEHRLVTLEIRARSRSDADAYAQSVVNEMREAVGLPLVDQGTEWVAPLGDAEESIQRFREQAHDLLDSEMYEMAVVAADVYFDLALKVLVDHTKPRTHRPAFEQLRKDRGSTNLSRDLGRSTVLFALGVQVTEMDEWAAYAEHSKRRNRAVHEGQVVTEAGARASIAAVEAMWRALNSAAASIR